VRLRIVATRHAKATSSQLGLEDDYTKILTPEGHGQAAALADILTSINFRPDYTMCSPSPRTVETAHHLSFGAPVVAIPAAWPLDQSLGSQTIEGLIENFNDSKEKIEGDVTSLAQLLRCKSGEVIEPYLRRVGEDILTKVVALTAEKGGDEFSLVLVGHGPYMPNTFLTPGVQDWPIGNAQAVRFVVEFDPEDPFLAWRNGGATQLN
jgi:phosphohistidine phosphatase SixA